MPSKPPVWQDLKIESFSGGLNTSNREELIPPEKDSILRSCHTGGLDGIKQSASKHKLLHR